MLEPQRQRLQILHCRPRDDGLSCDGLAGGVRRYRFCSSSFSSNEKVQDRTVERRGFNGALRYGQQAPLSAGLTAESRVFLFD